MTTDSSYQSTTGTSHMLGRLWDQLTEPPASIQDIERRRQLRLLAAMAGVGTLLIIIFGVIILPLVTQPDNPLRSPILYIELCVSVLTFIAYMVGRRGRYVLSASLLIAASLIGPWGTAIYNYEFAFLMVVASLFAFLFLPGIAVAMTTGVSLVGLFLLKVFSPGMPWDVVFPIAVAIITVPFLLFIARRHLDSVAREQQAILQAQNDALTHQAAEIDKVFRAASIGDFDVRAQVYGSDELGHAAEGVNAMLTQLGSLIQTTQSERTTFMESFGGVVTLTDMEGHITYINLAGAQILGYEEPAELVGSKRLSDLLLPEDWQTAMKTGIPTAINKGTWAGENRLLRADGTTIPVDQTLFVVRDEQGKPRNLGIIMTDISARKQTEANLAGALNVAKMAYVEIDIPSQTIYFDENFYKIYGVLPGQEGRYEMPLTTYIQRHLHPDTSHIFQEALQKAVESPDPDYSTEVIYRIIRANGEEGMAVGLARVQKDAEGNTIRILAANQDITEASLVDAQLAAQNEALGNALEELRKLIANVEIAARQVGGASESIVDVITLLTGQATTSAQLAEQAAENAQAGDQAVVDTISAMGRIRESSQETTRRIKRLGEASQEIGEAVRLIDEIADRVTILALNASIQAAAAGEAGRGFAVVAEEVQRLAERATNATRQIENMVKSIQGEIGEAVVGVEEATHEVVDGSQLAQSAGERISDLNQVVAELANLVQHVADTTSVQTTEALATLAALAADLQASVTALNIPTDEGAMSGNGSNKMLLQNVSR